jgi:hypothetical protein
MHNLAELEKLDIDYHDTTTFGAYTIKVEQDSDIESPREWDNLGTMTYWHRNYTLGDVDGSKIHGEFSSQSNFWIELAGIEDNGQEINIEKAMELAHKRHVILPLYLYDHSGITMSTTPFSCRWDSGQVGFIHISLEKIRKEFGCKRVSKQMRERMEGYLQGEVETYDAFITGNVHWFSITREDADGEEIDIDSCGGYYGNDEGYMFREIKSHIKYDIEHTPQQMNLI